jgi:hypothetical protein
MNASISLVLLCPNLSLLPSESRHAIPHATRQGVKPRVSESDWKGPGGSLKRVRFWVVQKAAAYLVPRFAHGNTNKPIQTNPTQSKR